MPSKQTLRREKAKQPSQRDELEFRAFSVRASTVDDKERSVETVISTETPVMMYDYDRWERVPEILRADGAIFPAQVPMLDNHARWSTEDQIGSARSISKEGNQIVGRLFFSSDATRQWDLVREGHLTDVSAGYQVIEKTFVPKNTTTTVGGRSYEGPVNVVTKWKLREVSLTPIGADEQAKLRGFDPTAISSEEGFKMNEALRTLLESRGMPKDLSDDAAQKWAVDNNFGEKRKEPESKDPIREAGADFESRMEKMLQDAADKAAAKAIEEQGKRAEQRKSIIATVSKLVDVDARELGDKLDSCNTREEIEKAFLDYKAERQSQFPTSASPVFSGQQEFDKFRDGMRTALVSRCLDSVGTPGRLIGEEDDSGQQSRREKALATIFPKEKRSEHAKNFRNASLYDMARTYVEQIYRVRSLDFSRDQIAIMAMFGHERACEILGIDVRSGGAYHTTGSFANLTLDAINKSMMLGYTEAPSTIEEVARIGADASDFKKLHRVRVGVVPNIPVWADDGKPADLSIADAREEYAVEARSAKIVFSFKLLVNDDMDALSRIPGQFGQAFRRTRNKVGWSIVTSNPTMSDGQPLFSTATGNRKRKNKETGAISNYTTILNTLTANMMVMRGENTPEGAESDDVLAITPRTLAFPAALRGTLLQLLASEADPNATHSGVRNINTGLKPVIEPLLDLNSTTAIYLFADPGQVDTIELTHLAGYRTPQTRQELDVETLSQTVYGLQVFAAKAMNHRGVQTATGA